jgi:hypothetical protein
MNSSDFFYIARDKFFDDRFFEDIKSIIGRYWKDMHRDLRVNGIRWSPTGINIIIVVRHDGVYRREWSHNIDDNKSTYYKEVTGCIFSIVSDRKLESLGI